MEYGFCPMTRDRCRDDCMWLDKLYDMDDDGIEFTPVCAVAGIYAKMLADGDDEFV